MTNPQRLSRRDWFRLRLNKSPEKPPTDSSTGASDQRTPAMGQSAVGLQDIPHPENHDGLDLSELPPMREALLDGEQVTQLFGDIEALGSEVMLMQRTSRVARASGVALSSSDQLRTARQSLLSGGLARLQIRYRWRETLWIDTLEAKPDGYRLIRIAHGGG